MRKYDFKQLNSNFKQNILHYEKKIYILDIIKKDIEENENKYLNINKRIIWHLEELLKNNKYNLTCHYYYENDDWSKRTTIYFNDDKKFSFGLDMQVKHKHDHAMKNDYQISIEEIENTKKRILTEMEKQKEILKTLKSKVNYFNKLMEKIEQFYNDNKELEYVLEISKW